jgi:hypothetical protein
VLEVVLPLNLFFRTANLNGRQTNEADQIAALRQLLRTHFQGKLSLKR